jgi:hypothetical protein
MANIHVVLIPQDQGAIYNPYAKLNIVSDRAGTVGVTVNPVGAILFPATVELTAPTFEAVIEGLIVQAGIIEVTTTMDGVSDVTQIEVIALTEVITLGGDLEVSAAAFPKSVTIKVWSNKPGIIDLVSSSPNIVLGSASVDIVDVPVDVAVTFLAAITGGSITASRGLITETITVDVLLNVPLLRIGPDQTILRGDADRTILIMVACDQEGTVTLASSHANVEVPASVVVDSTYYAEVECVAKGACSATILATLGALSDNCVLTVMQSSASQPIPSKGTSRNVVAGEEKAPFNINRESLPTLEDIDYAVYDWLNQMDIFTEGSEEGAGFAKVPIIWVGAERSFQTKVHKDLRDVSGSLKPPFIAVNRKGFNKDLNDKGEHWANSPVFFDFMQGVLPIKKQIRHDKTSQFINNSSKRKNGMMNYKFEEDEIKPVYETLYVPIPVYVSMNYEISIWTSYRTQMNTIQQKLLTYVPAGNFNKFVISHGGHNFEGFLDSDVTEEGNDKSVGKDERKILATFKLKVLGHVAGEEKNINSPEVSRRETAAKLTFDVENR